MADKSQVTTKLGDGGMSQALDGCWYSKLHPVMECVGALDELRAHLAWLRLALREHAGGADSEAFVRWLLTRLFVLGASCSDPCEKMQRPGGRLDADDLHRLEAEQARLEALSPLPHAFILAASCETAARADLACTVARRFERRLVLLRETIPEFDGSVAMPFVNRMSDYLYVLARRLEEGRHETMET